VALPFLAAGPTALRTLRDTVGLYIVLSAEYSTNLQAEVIAPPKGLTIEPVREVMASGDERSKAYAGYLMVLLGDRSGLDTLISYYRQQPRERYGDEWAKLVYRAIAVTNDPSLVPVLEEIYNGYNKSDTYRIRTSYWTLRSLNGEQ